MAFPPPFEVEDQTDEDFFDKLVDDEFSAERSPTAANDTARGSPDLSLDDTGTSVENSVQGGFVADGKDEQQNEISLSSDGLKADILPSSTSLSPDQSGQLCGGSSEDKNEVAMEAPNVTATSGKKGTGVKVVQWSSFDAGPEHVNNDALESFSEFFPQSTFGGADELQHNVNADFGAVDKQGNSLSTDLVSSEVADVNAYGSSNADVNDPQYWENVYPGWKYDASTGQWYQIDSYDVTSSDQYGNYNAAVASPQETIQDASQTAAESNSDNSGAIYLQQTGQSTLGTIQENNTLTNVSDWNMVSQPATAYPPNMVFDPQYPGWYYDTNTMQWYSLESYNQTIQMTSNEVQSQMFQNTSVSTGFLEENHIYNDSAATAKQSFVQDQNTQGFGGNWNASVNSYSQENLWQPTQNKEQIHGDYPVVQQARDFHSSLAHTLNGKAEQMSPKGFQTITSNKFGDNSSVTRSHSFVPGESIYQFNQMKLDNNLQSSLSNSYYGEHIPTNFSHQSFQGAESSFTQFSYSNEGRSSAGRPAHALVTFGFGGKLIVMNNISFSDVAHDNGMQGGAGATISVLNLSDVVKDKYDASSIVSGPSFTYFHSLFQQVLPGPLVGGSTAVKDVNKWLDDRVTSLQSPSVDYQKAKLLKLLLSLLKISIQHYGKLRSPFGSDPSIERTDGPEMAVTSLFASVKRNSNTFGQYGQVSHCMQNIPSEGQIRATAIEVQNLLVSGRRKEALQYAQEGQLWGPALVLAAQLGDEFYVDTVKKMAHSQLISGSPLRTLCLLIAGQPADVFAPGLTARPAGVVAQASQGDGNGILNDWEENLAVITANRTKDDELVIIHLGDCLWKEKGEVTAAHTCYLVAESNFEQYSDSARLCLIGADHWKYPRTYASPVAIQRTEIYEYSKVLGNSQFILRPFQPYKLIYAYMLAEVGKVSDSLRYCQASLKLLKNSSRAPEVEMLKSLLSSLEERLRTHQQGGYDTNLAPAKLVGKIFTSIDRSIFRMMGAPSASLPPVPQSTDKDVHVAPKVANSQSTMAMSSLVPSASVEAINDWKGGSGRKIMHNRSISEPDFGRSPKQDHGSDGSTNESMASGSRFGRFGFGSGILQKTIGWVSRSHRQAKLGDSNKFYYDEKLKRWVEEGAAAPAGEPALPPPPKVASFQNGKPDYSMNSTFKSENIRHTELQEAKPPSTSETKSGIPPIPQTQNQFSARGRAGVRSRYVDTFNKGGGAPTPSFHSPAVPSLKPMVGSNFFVPTIPSADEQRMDNPGDGIQEATTINDKPTASISSLPNDASFLSPASSSSTTMHRHPSMDNITTFGNENSVTASWGGNETLSMSRAASWSGNHPEALAPPLTESEVPQRSSSNEYKPTSFMSVQQSNSNASSSPQQNGGSIGDELHEVEL